MKNYILISGLNLNDNNRGTAALGYGSFSFLEQQSMLAKDSQFINFRYIKNPFKKINRGIKIQKIKLGNHVYEHININVFFIEKILYKNFNLIIPFTKFGKAVNKIKFIAAINGGDGFSDIYNTATFLGHTAETLMFMKLNIPVVILPQTIGPFYNKENYEIAERILKYATTVFVRDDKFTSELKSMNVKFTLTKDLSYYMQPTPFEIEISSNAVGLNISGLTYFNKFRTLAGQFSTYPYLIHKLIELFQNKNIPVYLIPHSYNYNEPVENNDDLEASKRVYNNLINKNNVYLINKDLKSPQLKYIISQMSFFIGTRMHANFAAIYTNTPLFGLSYSYKFQGAFEANGIHDSTAVINNISKEVCDQIIDKIYLKYKKTRK